MAQAIKQITIQAPGFLGLNSEDSPIGLDPNFSSIANNCVIDKLGRIGARKGSVSINQENSTHASIKVETVFESLDDSGTKIVFSAGNNKIYKGTTTLTDITPSGYTITANKWKVVNFNNHVYFFQRGHEPLVYTDVGTQGLKPMSQITNYQAPNLPGNTTSPYQANEALGAFGRIWVADINNDKQTVYWSNFLVGHQWTFDSINSPTVGSLNLREVFPSGHDEIVALQEHNGFLVIFCKNSIIIYSGAEGNPNADTFKLHDIIDGVGCIARDSVQHTGTDIVFLSDSGVRSLGRLIQEKSLPMRDISKNIRSDLLRLVNDEKVSNEDLSTITSVYSPDEAFYLLTLPKNTTTFCFDARGALPDGSLRVTTWSDPIALCYTIRHDGSLVMGRQGGIYQYKGFSDKVCKEVNSALTYVSQTYLLSYFSNPLDFGNSTNLKFLKKFKMIIIGDSSAESTLNWGYDYSDAYSKQTFIPTTINAKTAFFGISEYGISSADAPTGATPDFSLELIDPADPSQGTQATTALSVEYSGGTEIQTPSVHGTGHGTVVTVGLESTINGAEFSIQRIDINVLFGRVI
jgi:hypothetical protein|tara:strand:- start:5088 stop:6818 length:1731 start_codon:yes stop_codon:yes gene_type:complete